MHIEVAALESRIRRCVQLALNSQQVEDTYVELKGTLSPDRRTARQLAGHLNATSGDHVLWIIGVEESVGRLHGVAAAELQDAWSQLESHFVDQPPRILQTLSVDFSDKTVIGLLFSSHGRPFLVRTNPNDEKGVEWECPWRAGNRTRTSRRGELLDLLIEVAQTPRLSLLSTRTILDPDSDLDPHTLRRQAPGSAASFRFQVYATPIGPARLVYPDHLCRLNISTFCGRSRFTPATPIINPASHQHVGLWLPNAINVRQPTHLVELIRRGPGELVVDGPGTLEVEIGLSELDPPLQTEDIASGAASFSLEMKDALSGRVAKLDVQNTHVDRDFRGTWD